jgi:riboflavin-specific deaminase-like protein
VRGASPTRVVLDSTLRIPTRARVLDDSAPTLVLTTDRSGGEARRALQDRGVAVRVVAATREGVDLRAGLAALAEEGIGSLLVEGGARVITSLLGAGLADRIVTSIAPLLLGRGVEAVGDLEVQRVRHGVSLENRAVYLVGRDLMLAWDVVRDPPTSAAGVPEALR